MITLVLLSFFLNLPINYGQLAFNPVYQFTTYTSIGDSTFPIVPMEIRMEGFKLPYLRDISLFYSKAFNLKLNPSFIELTPVDYDSSLTLLNSSKGNDQYTYAGLSFADHYRPFYYSFGADLASSLIKKYSSINPALIYKGETINSGVFFYKFKRDSISYIKTLFFRNKLIKWKKTLNFFYAKVHSKFSITGVNFRGTKENFSYGFLFERLSTGKKFGSISVVYKEGIKIGLEKSFASKRIFPVMNFYARWRNLGFFASGDVIEPVMEDSSEIYHSFMGINFHFPHGSYLLMRYGNYSDTGIFAGHDQYFAGKFHLSRKWKAFTFDFAGSFLRFEHRKLDRSFNFRAVVSYKRSFKKENTIKLATIIDYFGTSTPHISALFDVSLFKAVFLRIEEMNLNEVKYPFGYPESGNRFYRISVVTLLKN